MHQDAQVVAHICARCYSTNTTCGPLIKACECATCTHASCVLLMTPDHRSECDTCHSAIEYAMAAAVIESHHDIARKHLKDKLALLTQAKADQRHAVALHNSDLEAINTERDRALALEIPALPSACDPCNVYDKDQKTWGPRVRARACVSTSHAACHNPCASFLRPTCQPCNGMYAYAKVCSALVSMKMHASDDTRKTIRLDQEDSDRAVAESL